jgi:hypothetical protein
MFLWSSSPVAQGRILNFRQRALQQRLGGSGLDTVGAVQRSVLLHEPRAHKRFGDSGRRGCFERSRGRKRGELADRNARGRLVRELARRVEDIRFLADQRRSLARQLGEERGGLLVAPQRTQNVEAHDVARAFPDRIDRCLTVKPRQHAFLDVAVAAEAFHGFVDEARRGLADPVFCRRRDQPRIGRFARVGLRGLPFAFVGMPANSRT